MAGGVLDGHPARYPRAGAMWLVLLLGWALLAGCALVSSGAHNPRAGSLSASSNSASGQPAPSPSTPSLTGSGLAQYYRQPVHWARCRQIFFCARILVPLDYSDPNGKAISLAVVKRPASQADSRAGSLIVNPGGPGASGIQYAENATSVFGRSVLDHFDIVGFDPRGVGASSPVDCVSDPELDRFLAADPDPNDTAEVSAMLGLLDHFSTGCEQRSGALLAHVSTAEAARDMDVLRALISSPKINYFGASYGTYLGATYAELFPKRVGRMVLDGAIDPLVDPQQMALIQAAGFQTALRAYVSYCVRQPDCPLGASTGAGLHKISDFFDALDRQPIAGNGERKLTEGYAVIGVWLPLYARDYWPVLTQALSAAFSGQGAQLLQLADLYTSRSPNGFSDNSNEAIYAVNCLDHPESSTIREVRRSLPQFERASSVFGQIFAWGGLACSQWPVSGAEPVRHFDAAGAAPILVVGTTRDPATPYKWAVSLSEELKSGVLLTRDGDGHTAYRSGNTCIDSTVDAYLVDGTVPPDGKRC